jgi:hypothetical protein
MPRFKPAAALAALALLAACTGEPTSARTPATARHDTDPLSMWIIGPPSGTPGHTCTWGAAVSGGTAPYTYYFEVDGVEVQHISESPSDIRWTVSLGTHTIYMEATDAASNTISMNKTVQGTYTNPQC